MNGIEILNKVPIYEATSFSIVFFLLLGIIAIVGYFLIGCRSDLVSIIGLCSCPISFCLLMTVWVASVTLDKIPILTEESGRYEYECIINDDVSFKELYDKYEIVEQNGKIWTIRDKRK